MKRLKRYLMLVLVLIGTFIITHKPTTSYIRKATIEYITTVFQPFSQEPSINDIEPTAIIHPFIEALSYSDTDDLYQLYIVFKTFDVDSINTLTINNKTYGKDRFVIDEELNMISVNFFNIYSNNQISFDLHIENVITDIDTYDIDYSKTLFKPISSFVISQTKNAMVSIKTSNRRGEGAWGSGVIFSQTQVGLNFEYLILTNYHVVENKTNFVVYFTTAYGGRLSLSATLEATTHDRTDLAILKITTRHYIENLNNDIQFQTLEAIEVLKDQPVFVVGSPGVNNRNYNKVETGIILKTKETITLKDSDICKNGCESFKTSITLSEGSSGGGTFDANGRLVGIHFAGTADHSSSNSIPMRVVLEFLSSYYEAINLYKKEVHENWTSFFYTT